MSERLTRSQQENLLVLLCWTEHAPVVRASIDEGLFEGLYADIALRVYDFIDQFNQAPGDHVADLMDDLLEDDEPRRAAAFRDILVALRESSNDVNAEYVLSGMREFVRLQTLRSGVLSAADILTRDEPDLDEAEQVLLESLQRRANVFEPGTLLSDPSALRFLLEREPAMETGIEVLDRRGVGPRRKTLGMMLAPKGSGKTWWMCHLGRAAILRRRRVLHVTLEVSEQEITKRYYQSFGGIATRDLPVMRTRLIRDDDLGHVTDIRESEHKPKWHLQRHDIRGYVDDVRRRWLAPFNRLVVKEFPTKQLSYRQLCAYVDMLERTKNFIPDLVLIDYPDLMDPGGSSASARWEIIGDLYARLRGFAVERNLAIEVVSQLNRSGARSARLGRATSEDIAEAWDKAATADRVLTLNATIHEKRLGLARIFADKVRDEEDKFELVITQDLSSGQFCVDSALLTSHYTKAMSRRAAESDDGGDEED